jgi:hypothetical protein
MIKAFALTQLDLSHGYEEKISFLTKLAEVFFDDLSVSVLFLFSLFFFLVSFVLSLLLLRLSL